MRDKEYPTDLIIGMTNLCTTHCSFCYKRELHLKPRFFPFERFKLLIDELGPKLKLLEFSGIGEPLMHPQFKEFVLYARQQYPPTKLKLQLVSNGSLLSADLRNFLIEQRFEQVWISLNAATSKTYSQVMPGLDFSDIIAVIGDLKEQRDKIKLNKPTIVLTFVVTKDNYTEAEDFLDLGIAMGVDQVAVRSVDRSLNKRIYDRQHVSRQHFEPILRRIQARAKSNNRIDCAPGWTFWPDDFPQPGQKGSKLLYCIAPRQVFGVYSTDGKVTPCCYLAAHIDSPGNSFGNIYEESALEIWKRANLFRQSLLDIKTIPDICKNCGNFWGKRWYKHMSRAHLDEITTSMITKLSDYSSSRIPGRSIRNRI